MTISAFELYLGLPTWAQNLAISVAGTAQRRRRYARGFRQKLAFLLESQYWDYSTVEAYQSECLQSILRHSSACVPFYADRMSEYVGGEPRQWLASLAVLTKSQVRQNSGALRAEMATPATTVELKTSGTTGTPLRIPTTLESLQWNYACFERFLSWHGVSHATSSAVFGGRVLMPVNSTQAPYWRKDLLGGRWLFSTYHISPATTRHYIDALNVLRPALIEAYPSALSSLAILADEQQLRLAFSPRTVVTSAETLQQWQRDAIERFFGCAVRDQYGCAEQVVNAGQCEKGAYHLSPECSIVEIVDDAGKPCPIGMSGHLVASGLTNFAFPLLRYGMGDVVSLSVDSCSCGRTLPVLGSIEGRMDDALITSDGRRVGRLAHVVAEVDGLQEAQFRQRSRSALDVLLVSDGDWDSLTTLIRSRLNERLPSDMAIAFHKVAFIPRAANGKFKFVVREFEVGP